MTNVDLSVPISQKETKRDKTMNKREVAEAAAKALLVQEFNENWSYDDLRELGWSGYAGAYMFAKKDNKTLTTSADLDIMMKFARFDQVLGATIPELIFYCCRFAPKKEFIKKLISLDTTRDKATLVKNLFDYTNEYGHNCLIVCFDMAAKYKNEHSVNPKWTTGMMGEIEECVQYLIQLGELNNVDIKSVLNHTMKDGTTLLFIVSQYSEKLALQLIESRVDVNIVDHKFLTPYFRFESIRQRMIDQGVNPHIIHYTGKSQHDYYSLSHLDNVTPLKSVYFIVKKISSSIVGEPWRYQNGIYPVTFTEVIGQDVEGSLLGGELNGGKKVTLKFVKISATKCGTHRVEDGLAELETRLSELSTIDTVVGSCVLKMLGHYRQQLCYRDDPKLAKMLKMKPGQIEQFEVFVKEKVGEMDKWSKNRISVLEATVEKLQGQVKTLEETINDMKECKVCFKAFDNDTRVPAKGKCQHALYCMACLRELAKTTKECPACRHPLKREDIVPVKLNFV